MTLQYSVLKEGINEKMKSLVGYTGFVGQNIANSCRFDGLYNSKNIEAAYGRNPELLVYAGVRSEMFLANQDPKRDKESIDQAIENIKKIHPKQLILISTISVYGEQVYADETTKIETDRLTAYGKNRLYLEEWVEAEMEHACIVRLPALYGKGIKKNFIYDYIHRIPMLLKNDKYELLCKDNHQLANYYENQDNGYYKCRNLKEEEKRFLISYFQTAGFSALNFTDSRAKYQFYNLAYLWEHIQIARKNELKKVNLVTEPIEAAELFWYLEQKKFENKITKSPFDYQLRTIHAELFGGNGGYIFEKRFVLEDIRSFILNVKRAEGIKGWS